MGRHSPINIRKKITFFTMFYSFIDNAHQQGQIELKSFIRYCIAKRKKKITALQCWWAFDQPSINALVPTHTIKNYKTRLFDYIYYDSYICAPHVPKKI